jgi:hypothetical protein
MKTKQILLVLVAFMVVAVTGCGKYDDGPGISFMPKKARLVNKWKLEKYYINDVEQTIGTSTAIMELKKDNSWTYSDAGSALAWTGTWAFDGNKENLLMTSTGSSTADVSKILRLKSNELWLSNTDGAITTEEHYVTE